MSRQSSFLTSVWLFVFSRTWDTVDVCGSFTVRMQRKGGLLLHIAFDQRQERPIFCLSWPSLADQQSNLLLEDRVDLSSQLPDPFAFLRERIKVGSKLCRPEEPIPACTNLSPFLEPGKPKRPPAARPPRVSRHRAWMSSRCFASTSCLNRKSCPSRDVPRYVHVWLSHGATMTPKLDNGAASLNRTTSIPRISRALRYERRERERPPDAR